MTIDEKKRKFRVVGTFIREPNDTIEDIARKLKEAVKERS